MINVNHLIGTHDVVLITLDTLRYDAAILAMHNGDTPNLQSWLPNGMWEKRHTPASFTYAAHHAFFAGFLPTPASPGQHSRLFAARFEGSETTTETTWVFEEPDVVTALAKQGYHTVCIGGVGFFNKRTQLGSVLPSLFHESHWSPELGVTDPQSTQNQVRLSCSIIQALPPTQRLFLFLNVSAIHQPNRFYLPGNELDNLESHGAALAYVDSQLPPLLQAIRKRSAVLIIITSDHGTTYGEDGFTGHRVGHPAVWTVPYAEFVLPMKNAEGQNSSL